MANGTWKLYIYDHVANAPGDGNGAVLGGWAITFSYEIPTTGTTGTTATTGEIRFLFVFFNRQYTFHMANTWY